MTKDLALISALEKNFPGKNVPDTSVNLGDHLHMKRTVHTIDQASAHVVLHRRDEVHIR